MTTSDLKSRLEAKRDRDADKFAKENSVLDGTSFPYGLGFTKGANEFIPMIVELAEVIERTCAHGWNPDTSMKSEEVLTKLNAWLGGECDGPAK